MAAKEGNEKVKVVIRKRRNQNEIPTPKMRYENKR